MEEVSITKMIYKEVMILRSKFDSMESDVSEIKQDIAVSKARVFGGAMVVAFIGTVIFQLILAVIQRG